MIFDTVNELLQKYRPYGIKGPPLPWNITMIKLSANLDLKKVFEEIKAEISYLSNTQTGKICTEDMILSTGIIDEERLQNVREEILANVLAEDIVNGDDIWTDYEFQETQVKLDIADMLLDYLASEIITLVE